MWRVKNEPRTLLTEKLSQAIAGIHDALLSELNVESLNEVVCEFESEIVSMGAGGSPSRNTMSSPDEGFWCQLELVSVKKMISFPQLGCLMA